MRTVMLALFAMLIAAAPAHAEFPRKGVDGIPNGVPEPFVGEWSVGFPEGEGVIVSELIVSCDAPVVLSAGKDGMLEYASPTGSSSVFELLEFEGRTTWMPPNNITSIAVWLSPDSFYLYQVNMMGQANWEDPRLYKRCS